MKRTLLALVVALAAPSSAVETVAPVVSAESPSPSGLPSVPRIAEPVSAGIQAPLSPAVDPSLALRGDAAVGSEVAPVSAAAETAGQTAQAVSLPSAALLPGRASAARGEGVATAVGQAREAVPLPGVFDGREGGSASAVEGASSSARAGSPLARARGALRNLWAKPAPPAPAGPSFDGKTAAAFNLQRSLSVAAFMVSVIAFTAASLPVVGVKGFGLLMTLNPLAGMAGPIVGALFDRLPARTGLVLNALIRGGLLSIAPAAHFLGLTDFWTLLAGCLANGYGLSSMMSIEGVFVARLFPGHVGNLNTALSINYTSIQFIAGVLLGVGALVDHVDPFMILAGGAAINLLLVAPLIRWLIPNVAPHHAPAQPASTVPLWRRYWMEAGLLAAATAALAVFGTALPITAALLFLVLRTPASRALFSGSGAEPVAGADSRRVRNAVLLIAVGAAMLYPLFYFVLPGVAVALAGAAGKGLLIGQFMGAVLLGTLISVASNAKRLPSVSLLGRSIGLQRFVQAGVVLLSALWVGWRLMPGNLLACAVAAAAAAGLLALTQRISDRGWIKLVGLGFASLWVPFAVWKWPAALPFLTVPAALYGSLVLMGLTYGASFVILLSYVIANSKKAQAGQIAGVQGGLFAVAISLGTVFAAQASKLLGHPFPDLLAVLSALNTALGIVFWLAPKGLPGLSATFWRR